LAQPCAGVIDERLWVTEGALKADIAAELLGADVIGMPGAGAWRSGLDLASRIRPGKGAIVVAYDMDFRTNPQVARHRDDLVCAAGRQGWDVHLAEWQGGKGVDDALAAGISLHVAPARILSRTVHYVERRLLPKRTLIIGKGNG
jgi:hypothetical protein